MDQQRRNLAALARHSVQVSALAGAVVVAAAIVAVVVIGPLAGVAVACIGIGATLRATRS